ncbi:polysaccharide deacetylase family protein [Dyadobacter sp. NIV53]|uniref:polysaccharide deacetylase family protein n=1 Tax=Dyadobacter sp. NIV53 TaxID=2861765 RepID=UPI001C87B5B2|nr:polysaccharide deacetylase family protein [Dyadobacter sp. NIV53]
MKNFLILLTMILISHISVGQKNVSVTIDDVPNVWLYESDGYSSGLLKKLDSLHLPIAIFINEGNLQQTKAVSKNEELLKEWILKDYITVGNHSYSHQNYGDIGFEKFTDDVLKGEKTTKRFLKGSGKTMEYFRFPFNSLGKDSLEHERILQFLADKKYISTPFTVESEDWMYAELYNRALREKDNKSAEMIGSQYVEMTIKFFDYFDSLAIGIYGRSVSQIYLCHDSKLNTDYLPEIIQKLKEKKYRFVSLKDAMSDSVYKSIDYFKGNNGISWLYRWMKDAEKRRAAMRAEPSNPKIHKAFEEMNKVK